MLTLTLTLFFLIAAIATGLSLLDSWMRGKHVYPVLKREKALLDAGYVPQIHADKLRLRRPAQRSLATIKRSRRRSAPLPSFNDATALTGKQAA